MNRAPDDAKAAPPRYQQVAADIQARIEAGEHRLGAALPTEQELCADYGVSRYTVREALRRLALMGLVHRRQGSGTEVIATEPQATYLHAMRSITELYEYAADTALDIAESRLETPDDETNRLLGRRPGRRWLHLSGVRRTRAGAPICTTEVWIHDDFADLGPEIPGLPGPIHRLLETRHGVMVEEVVQEFAAEPLPAAAAGALGLPAGAPSVRLTRRYLGEGDRPLIVSISWHPAERFSYTMRLRREDAGG